MSRIFRDSLNGVGLIAQNDNLSSSEQAGVCLPDVSRSRDTHELVSMNSAMPFPSPTDWSPRLLVVDDNRVNRRLAMAFAARLGWRSDEADSGRRALELVGEGSFDLVLLDISMPGLSGGEVLASLRGNPALRGLKVVAYTAHALAEEKRQIMESGFDDLLVKPISLQALADVLKAATNP